MSCTEHSTKNCWFLIYVYINIGNSINKFSFSAILFQISFQSLATNVLYSQRLSTLIKKKKLLKTEGLILGDSFPHLKHDITSFKGKVEIRFIVNQSSKIVFNILYLKKRQNDDHKCFSY